eukprot:3572757-Pyramimonas_sp.AAC.1
MEGKTPEGFPLRFFQDPSCAALVGEALVTGASSVSEVVDPEAAGRIDPLGLYPQHVVQVLAEGVGIDPDAKLRFEIPTQSEFDGWMRGIQ